MSRAFFHSFKRGVGAVEADDGLVLRLFLARLLSEPATRESESERGDPDSVFHRGSIHFRRGQDRARHRGPPRAFGLLPWHRKHRSSRIVHGRCVLSRGRLRRAFSTKPPIRGLVRLAEDSRPSLTPPFPASLRFTLALPDAAFLRFSPALVARQEVRRAAVEFVVNVGAETVYEEFFDFEDANQWHDREVDLSAWAGRRLRSLSRPAPSAEGRESSGRIAADGLGQPRRRLEPSGTLSARSPAGKAPVSWDSPSTWLIGGLLGLAIRWLFVRFGAAPGDRSALGNLFPLVTLSTIVVLTVVQASIPLSLGLLGALSIVRFRSAIKTPEELVYVLFAVAVGLSLGAQHRALAIVAVVVVGFFIVLRSRFDDPRAERSFHLSIAGDARRFFEETVLARLARDGARPRAPEARPERTTESSSVRS